MRKAGILLSITSLPSEYGIGSFSKEAYEFADFLKASGQSYWQILPLGPTSYGDSPYQSFSAFAGNPYMIDINSLTDEGVLDKSICDKTDFGTDSAKIDYEKIYNGRFGLLYQAYKNTKLSSDFYDFCKKNSFWLDGYAEFMAYKTENNGAAWNEWQTKNSCETEFWKYIQFKFFEQWQKLKAYVNKNGIKIIGDIPIYCAYDSVDVWKNPNLFELDNNNVPIAVAGCPPDGFSPDGQLWGNPLYRWSEHKRNGYDWWTERVKHCFSLYDCLRIDHFRGFDEYYAIPYKDKTAKNGRWQKGPGKELFECMEKELGKRDIIAEDLGFITDSVKQMLSECHFPGMRIFEFAFDSRDGDSENIHLPHNYPSNCVAYTHTHDNEPLTSWFMNITDGEREAVRRYLCDEYTPNDEIALPIISRVMQSEAELVIVPLQDYLMRGGDSRMNTPSTLGGNWQWRIEKTDINDELATKILTMTKTYGRQ